MYRAKQTHKPDYEEYPVKIPFQGSERDRFLLEAASQQKTVRQLVRMLCLVWMDPATGPIVEAAMRGRPVPDLAAGQAQELSAALTDGACYGREGHAARTHAQGGYADV